MDHARHVDRDPRWHWSALIVASLAIVVGWKPTIWLLVAFVLLVAVQRRNHLILNSGDIILRDFTLLLAFTPTGAAFSLDRYPTPRPRRAVLAPGWSPRGACGSSSCR